MLLFTYDEKLHKENEKNENIAEGLALGRESMQVLIKNLLNDNRMDDIKKISEDTDHLNQLLEEYNL